MRFITPTDTVSYISITFLLAVFASQCNSLIQYFFKLIIFAGEKGSCYARDIGKINLKTLSSESSSGFFWKLSPVQRVEESAASTDCKLRVLQTQDFQIATYFC